MNVELTPDRIQIVVQGMIMFILSVAIHEFGHAWMATRLGDRLPTMQGRVTLNPVAHIDPIGTLLLPAFFLLSTGGLGFAWGKPVYHTIHDRRQRVLVAFAGPAMNVVLAAMIATLHIVLIKAGVLTEAHKLGLALTMAVFLNFILFFFNLLPALPLDGGSVVRGLIPYQWLRTYDEYSKYGPFVVMAFLLIPGFGRVVSAPAEWMTFHLYDVLQKLAGLR